MDKFWIVFKREYLQVVKKKSFLIGIFLTPLLMGAFTLLPAFLASKKASDTQQLAVIDQSGTNIGTRFEEELVEYELDDGRPYYNVHEVFEIAPDDEAGYKKVYDSLTTSITENLLKFVLVIKPEPLSADSNVFLLTNSENLRSINRFEYKISQILSEKRLEKAEINIGIDSVLTLTKHINLKSVDAKGESLSFQTKYFSAMIFIMIMFGMIFGYGQLVMRTVIEEKNSRIMEVLISSVSPFQLLLGKILGLGGATFTQISIWAVLGAGIYLMRGMIEIDPGIDRILFNPAILIFFVLFLISGYLLYSTLFALLGSIFSSEKEAQNFVAPISISLILPIMIAIYVIQEPNSLISIIISYIPFLTPTMMLMRVIFIAPTTDLALFSGIVPQAILGFILVSCTVAFMIWLTSKIFRVGILMYGKRPTLPELVKWIKY